jgi:conjugative relaxase-like TrwC/TraI family protein
MMTLHKLHAGDGYTYLTRQVAAGDEGRSPGQQLANYYTASGNPPGRWLGTGAANLEVTGRVREDQMRALFGRGMHPDADQIIALEVAAGAGPQDAAQAAKLGRAFPQYTPLPPRSQRVAKRLADFESENGHQPSPVVRSKIEGQEARRERRAVAGYDLVFTPVKSASLLWALGSSATRQAVEDAHHEAVANTLAWLEEETAFARTGDAGEQQIETRGFLAAAFDHRDSRAGDPDLHTHLAISNKVRAREDRADGTPRWLSLDARVIHAAAVAASERYNTRFEDALTRRLGVSFEERADSVRADKRVIREVTGIPLSLVSHFSKRRADIEDRYHELASQYRHSHGHEPPRGAQLKLAQQATLETRDDKAAPRSLAAKLAAWRQEALAVIGTRQLEPLEHCVTALPPRITSLADLDVASEAANAVGRVSVEKATWTRWNVTAEIERQLRPLRFPAPADRETAVAAVLDHALHPGTAVQLTPDGANLEPALDQRSLPVVRRSNGENVLVDHGSARYTTQDLLDAEQRLLEYAHQPTSYALAPDHVHTRVKSFEERNEVRLDPGQRDMVLGFAADPRRLVVGIGPAGAGKTTAMRALAATWRSTGRRVVPLAPSAAAADVLSAELGCRAENLHKFRHTHTSEHTSAQAAAGPDPWFVLNPGDLVLVDEGGMAGTRNLAWLTDYARDRGALVRLLGDPAQLGSVEAGGALGLLADDAGAVELTDLHRFTDPAEAAATIGLREGRPEALDYYFHHDSVRSGSTDAMQELAYDAWVQDIEAGRNSLLLAASNRDATALNTRARLELVARGTVETAGITLQDGTRAGVGDHIVTRKNARRLTTRDGGQFVKNGDTWTVERRHRNGDLTVRHQHRAGTVRLPREYVEANVELGYATTTARAQGRTVDTTHVLIDEAMSREALYVAATRARHHTQLYVPDETLLGHDAERPPSPRVDPHDRLTAILGRRGGELSATETRRQAAHETRPTAGQPAQRLDPNFKAHVYRTASRKTDRSRLQLG